MTSFNCTCDDTYPKDTLQNLRTRLMRRTGYSAQAASPPPGLAELYNDFIQEAQRLCYMDYSHFRNDRYFLWPLVDDEAFYDYEDGADVGCTKLLTPEKIKGAWIVQDGRVITHLGRGIPASVKTSNATGYPTRFDLRQCIELWPVPKGLGNAQLLVLGAFGLNAFTSDGHFTTISPDVVFMRALANAKAHLKHPDAGNYIEQEQRMVARIVESSHVGKRYIPASKISCGDSLNGICAPFGTMFFQDGDVIEVSP